MSSLYLEPIEKGLYKPSFEDTVINGFTSHASGFLKEKSLQIGEKEVDYSSKNNLVFLLIDGLGRELGLNQQFVKWFNDAGEWKSTVYPSITPTALTSIFTGKSPLEHGITGHLIPWEKAKKIVDFIRSPCLSLNIENNYLQKYGSPLLSQGFVEKIYPPLIYTFNHSNLVGKGVFAYLFGKNSQPFFNLTHLFYQLKPLITAQKHRKIIIIYYAMYDIMSHFMGKISFGAMQVIQNIVRFLKKFENLPNDVKKQTTVLVGSDHGHEFINKRISLSEEERKVLGKCLYGVGKSGRTVHFYPRPEYHDKVYSYLEKRLSSFGLIFDRDEIKKLMGSFNSNNDPEVGNISLTRAGSIHFTSYPGYYLEWPFSKDFFERGLDFGRRVFYSSEHGGLSLSELQTPFLMVL